MLILAGFGFVAGENAVQPASVANGIWMLYTLLPSLGIVVAVIILRFYKLRDKDVQVMAQYNNLEISKEEAESKLADKYGPAADLVMMTISEAE
jgi:Na+/melibiose symporter-like transporter